MKIQILETPEYKKGYARAKWFTAIKRYDGKAVDDFVAPTTKKPPVLTKSGEGEAPFEGENPAPEQSWAELSLT